MAFNRPSEQASPGAQTQLVFDGYAVISEEVPETFRAGRSFWSAYLRGWREGPDAICPYRDKRSGKFHSHSTFSSAWRRFWREGCDDRRNGRSRYHKST